MKWTPIIDVAPLVGERVSHFAGVRPYVATGDARDDGTFDWVPVTYDDRPSRADVEIQGGDVTLARMKSTSKVIAFECAEQLPILSTGFAVFRPDPKRLDQQYLKHWLRSEQLQREKDQRCSGAIQPAITNQGIAALEIPLPPIEEQRRIASILNAADALRSKRRQALEKLDTLTQSIFIAMFGDPLDSGYGGSVQTSITALGELARVKTGKLDANAASANGAYPFFTCGEETLRIDVSAFDTKATLVAGNGTLNVKYYEGKFNAYQRTYVIDSLDESIAHPRFLHGFLDIYVGRLREQAIGGVIKYIKLGMLTEAGVPLPSIDDQHEFVRRVEAANATRHRIDRSMESLDCLYSSLTHQAFGAGS